MTPEKRNMQDNARKLVNRDHEEKKHMSYIAEILADDVVWVINENRLLISIHQTMDEANYYCRKHFKVAPQVVDRRNEHRRTL